MANRKPPKNKEKHVTLLEPTHDKLVALAKKQHRSLRGVVTHLIEQETKREEEAE